MLDYLIERNHVKAIWRIQLFRAPNENLKSFAAKGGNDLFGKVIRPKILTTAFDASDLPEQHA